MGFICMHLLGGPGAPPPRSMAHLIGSQRDIILLDDASSIRLPVKLGKMACLATYNDDFATVFCIIKSFTSKSATHELSLLKGWYMDFERSCKQWYCWKDGFADRPPAFQKDRLRLKLYKLKYHPKIAIIQRVPLLATRWFAFIWFLFTCLVLPTIIQFRKLTTSMFFSSRFVSGLLQLWSYKINSEKNGQVPRWYQYKWMVICVFFYGACNMAAL